MITAPPEPLFNYTVRLSTTDREWLKTEAERLRRQTGADVRPSDVARQAIQDAQRRGGGV